MMAIRCLALVAALALTTACGSSNVETGYSCGASCGSSDGGGGETAGRSSDGAPQPTLGGDADEDAATPPPGCSSAATLVYVIDATGILYSFDPSALKFQMIAPVQCPFAMGGVNSMAVDRNGTAWVNDQGGSVFKVSTANGSCQTTTFSAAVDPTGFGGMGVTSTTSGGTSEALYICTDSSQIQILDRTSLTLKTVGSLDGPAAGMGCELTGSDQAQLFGFCSTSPPSVVQIDPSTAHVLSSAPQPGVTIGSQSSYAFSYWGGDFYIYTAEGTATSSVTRYSPSTGKTTTVLTNIGFQIVGAGVSTCAPTQQPQ
jgi:hypothetical protein